MFVVRRAWDVEPGNARQAAVYVAAMGEEYEAAGKRGASRVYFDNGTVPGERCRVYMEWTEDVIDSTYRTDNIAGDAMTMSRSSSRMRCTHATASDASLAGATVNTWSYLFLK